MFTYFQAHIVKTVLAKGLPYSCTWIE